MTQPIIDPSTLTEEQRDKIIKLFYDCSALITKVPSFECGVNVGSMTALKVVFGQSMFKKDD